MRLLIVEDQKKMARALERGLSDVGYNVDVAETGAAALEKSADNTYNLVLLDVMLPDCSGLDVAKNLRKEGFSGPILMLTALQSTAQKVAGLDSGADDYLPKPFEFDELLARIRALIRRAGQPHLNPILNYQDLELDPSTRIAKRDGQVLKLTQKEFSLLEFFLRNAERPVTRTSIAEHVWETHFDGDSNVIDVYVNLLRKKVDAPFKMKLIQTLVGHGYVLKNEASV